MSQQIINNSETGLVVRGKINANFTELYTSGAALDVRVTANEADITDIYATAVFTNQLYADPVWLTSLSSNKLVGQIPLALIPPSALERMFVYGGPQVQPWLIGLTNVQVQTGDTVLMVNDNNKMWLVVDDTQLNVPAGFQVYTAGSAASVPWAGVTGTPTTLAGYGITDAWRTSGLTNITAVTVNGGSFVASLSSNYLYELTGANQRSVKLDNSEFEITYENGANVAKITTNGDAVEFGVLTNKINITGGVDPTVTYTAPKHKFTGVVSLLTAPANDNALVQILARDSVTGEVKYRTAASITSAAISGTVNRIAKFATVNSVGDSSISDVAGVVSLTVAPANDNALVQVLVRDTGTGEIKYRTVASLVNGTINRVAKFTAAGTVGDSSINDTGVAVFLTVAPANDNALVQVLARDTGTGEVKYRTVASIIASTVAGAINQIQYNNGASGFGANANFVWDIANGRLGVGTATPTARLQVAGGNINVELGWAVGLSGRFGSANGNILFNSGTADNIAFAETASNTYTFGKIAAINTALVNNILTLVTNTGNVGIGTASPFSTFHVVSTTTDIARFQYQDGANFPRLNVFAGAATKLVLQLDGSVSVPDFSIGTVGSPNLLFIKASTTGNVGIGTTSPQALLHLIGNIRMDNGAKLYSINNDGASWFLADSGTPRFVVSSVGAITISNLTGSGNSTVSVNAGGTLFRSTALTFEDITENLIIGDGKNIFTGLITGTKFGSLASNKLSLWGATPDVQPTNTIVAAARVVGGGGTINVTDTFGGYNFGQVVAALKRLGALA